MTEPLDLQRVSMLRTGDRRNVFAEAPPEVFDDSDLRGYLLEHPRTLAWLLERRSDFPADFYARALKHFMIRWGSGRLQPTTRILALIAMHVGLPEAVVAELQDPVKAFIDGPHAGHIYQARAASAFQVLLHTEGGLDPWPLTVLLDRCRLDPESIEAVLDHPDLTLDGWASVERRVAELEREAKLPRAVEGYEGPPPAIRPRVEAEVARFIVEQDEAVATRMYRRARAWLRASQDPDLRAVLLQSESPEIRLDAIAHLRDDSSAPPGMSRGR